MTRWPPALALLVSLLIVTAGPLSSAASLESTTNGADVQSVSAPTAESILRKAPQGIESEPTSTRTAGPKTTETITNASGNQASPWGTEELIVAIDRTTTNQSNVSRLVADALEYWNTAGNEYATYPVKFTLRPAAANPDIVVRFKPDIDCTRARWELGCAPIIEPGSSIDHPALVRIDAEYTKATTRRVLKHEFGHIVGIRHGEAPTELMRPQYAATTRRQLPNASEPIRGADRP
ncbi:MAG: matrixin family metalloprotease [Halobacteriales archaeon]